MKLLFLTFALGVPAIPAVIVTLSLLGLMEAAPFGARPDGFSGMHPLAAAGWGFGVYFVGLTVFGILLLGADMFKRARR